MGHQEPASGNRTLNETGELRLFQRLNGQGQIPREQRGIRIEGAGLEERLPPGESAVGFRETLSGFREGGNKLRQWLGK